MFAEQSFEQADDHTYGHEDFVLPELSELQVQGISAEGMQVYNLEPPTQQTLHDSRPFDTSLGMAFPGS